MSLKQISQKVAAHELAVLKVKMAELENEHAKVVNMLITVVRGNGGEWRIPKVEFLKIQGCRLHSIWNEEAQAQILTVSRDAIPRLVK